MLKIKKKEECSIPESVWREYVLEMLERHKTRGYTFRDFIKSLGVKSQEGKSRLRKTLMVLKDLGEINEVRQGTFQYKREGIYTTGVVELNRSGSAYIRSREFKEKIFVPFTGLKHALNGDTVKVLVYADGIPGMLSGKVEEILHKKKSLFVGIIYCQTGFAFLIPTGNQVPYDVYIPSSGIGMAQTGDKVLAEIVSWPKKRKNPEGRVLKILGRPGDGRMEMKAIMAEFDLAADFPLNVLRAAKKIRTEIPADEYIKRRDCRDLLTFTVDPKDAHDFDDALSFKEEKEGLYEVGVHIADVSYYVRPATVLDKEAYLRAHSVYLAGCTIPMLPERLSNDICSLNPHQDRLCYSVVVKIDREGSLVEKWIGRTVICSDYLFSYEEAQKIIEWRTHPCRESIGVLYRLSRKMRKIRDEKGALCFNQPEVRFDLDSEGKPIRVYLKEMKEANRMIEEWMLLANRIIAEAIGKEKERKAVFIYRTHGVPTVDRLHIFRHLAGRMGLRIKGKLQEKHHISLAKQIRQLSPVPMRSMVESLFIRTLAKAAYSVDNIGHYGLAFDYYTHFTSPIRRYSDLVVHRLLEHYMNGGRSVRRDKYWEICRHVSEMEVIAENAERASVRYKQLEYLSGHAGTVWSGKITEILRWGFYVELDEIRCEGLVSILNMRDDYYEFQEKAYRLVGRNFGRSFCLGEQVVVKVLKVDLASRFLDFVLAGEAESWEKLDDKDLPMKTPCKRRKGRKKCRVK